MSSQVIRLRCGFWEDSKNSVVKTYNISWNILLEKNPGKKLYEEPKCHNFK